MQATIHNEFLTLTVDTHGAEAVSLKNAAGQLGGAVLRRAQSVYDALQDIASHYHAVIDYPDEDIPDFQLSAYEATLTDCIDQLQRLLDTFSRANVLHGGVPAVILGRPNAGKSSLVNAILRDKRTIVSDVAGTTRDAIDVPYLHDGQPYVLIDTAGMRPRSRRNTSVEVFSAMRSEKAIRRADICLLVIDIAAGITQQDRRIAGIIAEEGKPCIITVSYTHLTLPTT